MRWPDPRARKTWAGFLWSLLRSSQMTKAEPVCAPACGQAWRRDWAIRRRVLGSPLHGTGPGPRRDSARNRQRKSTSLIRGNTRLPRRPLCPTPHESATRGDWRNSGETPETPSGNAVPLGSGYGCGSRRTRGDEYQSRLGLPRGRTGRDKEDECSTTPTTSCGTSLRRT
jgi:hypothetical protein